MPESKPKIHIRDEYGQSWLLDEYDVVYEEARLAKEMANGNEVVWHLQKILQNRGWGWWTVWANMEQVVEQLTQQIPDPNKVLLMEPGRDYALSELREKLQQFGGYLGFLNSLAGRIRGEENALNKGYKGAILVGTSEMKAGTETAKEAHLLESSELLRQTKRLQINSESVLLMVEGWIKSYEKLWETTSRLITVQQIEAGITTNRHD